MSCLSKALSVPPRAPQGRCTARPHVGCLRGPWCSGDGMDPARTPPSSDTKSERAPCPAGVSTPRQGSRTAPALRTVSSWSGVSSDSQITSWLWVVQGAPHRSTAPHCWGGDTGTPLSWGTRPHSCPRAVRSHWLQPRNSRCVPGRAAQPAMLPGSALAPAPRAHEPWRNRFGPCGQSGPPGPAGRAGRERGPQLPGHVLLAAAGWFGASWVPAPRHLAWCHVPGPVPTLERQPWLHRSGTRQQRGPLLWRHRSHRAAQLCRCNQDHNGAI